MYLHLGGVIWHFWAYFLLSLTLFAYICLIGVRLESQQLKVSSDVCATPWKVWQCSGRGFSFNTFNLFLLPYSISLVHIWEHHEAHPLETSLQRQEEAWTRKWLKSVSGSSFMVYVLAGSFGLLFFSLMASQISHEGGRVVSLGESLCCRWALGCTLSHQLYTR